MRPSSKVEEGQVEGTYLQSMCYTFRCLSWAQERAASGLHQAAGFPWARWGRGERQVLRASRPLPRRM